MCGISGILANQITEQQTQLIDAVINSQVSRGPDHQAKTHIKGRHVQALLGHNRLSIIDLSEHANQPMWDDTHRYCIVYNGEIYNYIELRDELKQAGYQFNNASDTEIILNAFSHWGIHALNRFHGPFAFAIFDAHKEELWLCRDRFGIRPLFHTQLGNVLYFASTSSVLAKTLSLKPELSYIAKGLKYLVYEDGSDTTAYQNLLSIPAGSYLHAKFDENNQLSCAIKTYYDLEHNVQNIIFNLSAQTTNELLERVNSKLENAVNIRLRTDVPLGISLSGGLDSSSVAALVSNQHKNTIGFSFGHPDIRSSEGPLVSKCADYLKMHIEYVWPNQIEMIDGIDKTIAAQDAPFSSLSIVAQYLLYKKVNSSGIKVLLGGQGGDEAFMGYKKFLLFQIQQAIKMKQYFIGAKKLFGSMPMLFSEMTALKTYWKHRHRYTRNNTLHESTLRFPEISELNLRNSDPILWKRQMLDITKFSLPTLLRYEDRNAMGNSVESRLPYMDHQLLELGLALPESIKLHAGYGKWAIRKIMAKKIPDQIRLARYKRGFDIPISPLIKAGLGKSIRKAIHGNSVIAREFLKEPKEINKTFSDQQLIERKNTVSEAITLLWLNKVIT